MGRWIAILLVALISLSDAIVPVAATAQEDGKRRGLGWFARRREADDPLTRSIGDIAEIIRTRDIEVEGIGLVVNLEETGNDPPPSIDLQHLLDRMSKAGVEDADSILNSPRTAMVLVKTRIPVGITSADPLDVTLELLHGDTTTSLAGGWLLETRLSQVVIDGENRPREGDSLALAGPGPILVDPEDANRGRIPGGAYALQEFPLRIRIDEAFRGYRSAKLIENVIARRFYRSDGVKNIGVADAKTDSLLELDIPPSYRHNQVRFARVVKSIPLDSRTELTMQRIESWSEQLRDPSTAAVAAIRLEAMGRDALEALYSGLESPNPQARFFAAEALAYLDDPAGVDVLAEATRSYPELRSYALTALSVVKQNKAAMALRRLMDVADPELRYGAFEALRHQDPFNPFLRRISLLPPVRDEGEEGSGLRAGLKAFAGEFGLPWESYSDTIAAVRRSRPNEPFELYAIASDGPPMVHVRTRGRREIVLFGAGQELRTPAALTTGGAVMINASLGDRKVIVSRVGSLDGTPDMRKTVPNRLVDVIVALARINTAYHDVVTILQAAERQRNLSGSLHLDARPTPNEDYLRALAGEDVTREDAMEAKVDGQVVPASAEPEEVRKGGPFGFFRKLNPFRDRR